MRAEPDDFLLDLPNLVLRDRYFGLHDLTARLEYRLLPDDDGLDHGITVHQRAEVLWKGDLVAIALFGKQARVHPSASQSCP